MDEIKTVLSAIDAYFTDAAWFQLSKWPFWILLFLVASGGIYTARFGKKTLFCRGMSGALNLVGIYQATVLLCAHFPILRTLPFSLPYLAVTEKSVSLVDPLTMDLATQAPMLLQLMYLMLLVDFVETLNPGGKTLLSWLFSQFVTVSISLAAYLVTIAFFKIVLPCFSGAFAILPVLMAAALFLLMLCGKFIFTVVMEGGNPQFRNIYSFFTGHKFGTLLTVSALSFSFCAILFLFLYLTDHTELVFRGVSLRGLNVILLLILAAEYFYTMLYCGKKK